MQLSIATQKKKQVIDITEVVNESLAAQGCRGGLCHLFLKHTTAALSCADLDPGTDLDYLDAFEAIVPQLNYRHPHDPSHVGDHIMSAMIGCSLTLPVTDGQLDLGAWQRVVLIELDGPRKREMVLRFAKTA